jgi:hypothetical protein
MVVILSADEIMVLNLFKSRLFIPIEVIIDKVFNGNIKRAIGMIDMLVERNMLEYALINRVTITLYGKKALLNELSPKQVFAEIFAENKIY